MDSTDPTLPPQIVFQQLYIAAKLISPSRDKHALDRGPWIDVGDWIQRIHGQESNIWIGYKLIDDPRRDIIGDSRECVSDLLVSLLDLLRPYVMSDC